VTMLPEELLKKVRRIEITTRKLVDDALSGNYRTHFKGHGVTFSEHRLYVPGDDVRHIDWKVSARSRDPLIKKYEEERELTVFLVVDVSASEAFGSGAKLKSEIQAEVAAMLAYAATHTGDKVGALLFAGQVEEVVRPAKGRGHVMKIAQKVLTYEAKTSGTNLAAALDAADRIMKHAGVVFILSDFIATGYEMSLRRLARRHDVVAVSTDDPRETDVPDLGHFFLRDPETGVEHFVDTGSYAFRKWMKEQVARRAATRDTLLRSGQVEQLRVSTSDDYGEAVVRFFAARSRKRR
jgi:uncharacterized protein (DUF58 family)